MLFKCVVEGALFKKKERKDKIVQKVFFMNLCEMVVVELKKCINSIRFFLNRT